MKKLVSVIVPIYNTSCYLDRCITSIINQTYDNIEVILVDDGSTDNSLEICKVYENKDERITIYSKKNGGVSSARNLGINCAKGEYIMFVDSDDYIELDMIEKLIEITVDDVKMSMCTYKFYPEKDKGINYSNMGNKVERYHSRGGFLKKLQDNWGPFCKLYCKELIGDIRFDENVAIAEDLLFNARVLCENEQYEIAFIDTPLYIYCLSTESATRQKYNTKILVGLEVEEKVYNLFMRSGLGKDMNKVLVNGIRVFYSKYSKLSREDKKKYSTDYEKSRRIIRRNICYLVKWKGRSFIENLKMMLIILTPRIYFMLNGRRNS